MQFKNPEILYFLFLLVIPILVHLFQLRRFKKEYFTNVSLLKQLTVQTRKSAVIKKWLLLTTRLLLLSCLIIAFAQPFFETTETSTKNKELYIVLDTSFSMQAKGKSGQLLKRAIQELLENIPENQIFTLITPTEVFWETDINSIRKELQNIKFSASPFELENAMSLINSKKTIEPKEIVFITDGLGLQQKQLESIGANSAYFVIPESEQKENISIDSVYIKETLSDFYKIDVRINSYGNLNKEIPISVYDSNKLIAKTNALIKGKTTIVPFTIQKKEINGTISIDDGALVYDNTYYFSISKPEKTNVISIGTSEKSEFLSRIYTPDEFNYSNFPLDALNYNQIQNQETIVLNELNTIPLALQTTLKSFVEKGGTLILIPSPDYLNTQLNSFLLTFGTISFGTLQSKEKLITKIASEHPIFSSVFDKKITTFQYPKVKTSFPIKTTYPSLLYLEDQSPFLTSIPMQTSSVFIFSAPININNSTFQNSPLIVPTFYRMAQNESKTGRLDFRIGTSKSVLIDAKFSKGELATIKNNQEEFVPQQEQFYTKIKLSFNDNPRNSGNFYLYNQKEKIKNISFNYNRTEGEINEFDKKILSGYKMESSISTIFDSIQSDRMDSDIWKWFIIFTLLFLITEIIIQKFVQ
jgi:hypothetical protein